MADGERYINPFTDFGFKKIFGSEPNKDLLKSFLNALLYEQEGEIVELNYSPTEQIGINNDARSAVFDILCTNEKGEQFIVEMQKSKQAYFKERSVFYATFPIHNQAKQGAEWKFDLKAVYMIAILGFEFDDNKENPDKMRYDVKLVELETNKIWYDKLTLIYLEMPKFKKELHELKNEYEKWLYVIKNLHRLDRLPDELRTKVFEKFFEIAEISKLSHEEWYRYQRSMNAYRDITNTIDYAKKEGFDNGYGKGYQEATSVKQKEVEAKQRELLKEQKERKNDQERAIVNLLNAGMSNETNRKNSIS